MKIVIILLRLFVKDKPMTSQAMIPLFYPVRTEDMEQTALQIVRSGQIASGPLINKFERAFGQYVKSDHVVTINDMTSALVLALRLTGVKSGDHVATISFSCLSTNSAIAIINAKALWIDIDPATMSMCPDDLIRKLTPSTKAVLLYHVAGYPAQTKVIAEICQARGIFLIEDCNNALGAEVDGQLVGQQGQFAVYSFYPNRQINGFEGAALICPNVETAEQAKRLRRFGVDYANFRDDRGEINPDADVPEIGLSAALNQLNAAVAHTQLLTVSERLFKTRQNAQHLVDLIRDIQGIEVVKPVFSGFPAYWCLLIHAEQRNKLLISLKAKGISCSILHHRNDSYSGFGNQNASLLGTEYIMNHLLALPCGWWLDGYQLDYIAKTIRAEGVIG